MKLGHIRKPKEKRKTKRCKVCADLPWARTGQRFARETTAGRGVGPVVISGGVCRGCGKPYEAEHVRFQGTLIGSSAATAVNYGRIYGERVSNGKGR